jgi:hypothetical protein
VGPIRHLLNDGCLLGFGHVLCTGCGCICHWDKVLVEYFAKLGRLQDPEQIEMRRRPGALA